MENVHPEAEELNRIISSSSKAVYSMLSEKGRGIYFPKRGIVLQSAEAKGKGINATAGIAAEDDKSPMRLASIEKHTNLKPSEVFSYAPSSGKPELRERWKEMLCQKNPGLEGKAISLPVVTNALTHGLSVAGFLFADNGDGIIIPEPYWGNYNLIFKNWFGARVKTFGLFKGEGLDLGGLEDALSTGAPGKRILILNFPNNPTGYTPTEKEAKEIVSIIKRSAEKGNHVIVLCDDAYFGLVYKEGICKESLFSELADIHENVLAVKLCGATKEDYSWGLRVGFITFGSKGLSRDAYKALEEKAIGAIRGNISNSSNLSQSLVLRGFSSVTYGKEKKEKYDILKKRFETVSSVLSENRERYSRYFSPLLFNSGYFMCIRLDSKNCNGKDAEAIRKHLLENYDTGVIAMRDLIRIAYSNLTEEDIPKVFDNIYNACRDLCG